MKRKPMTLLGAGAAVAALVLTGLGGTAAQAATIEAAPAAQATAAAHFTGTLADGATWVADRPDNWNGTLVLYSHGFGSLQAVDAPDPQTKAALLADGYALVGSSYIGPSLWAVAGAAKDQVKAMNAAEQAMGNAHRILALGTSMGGLISAQEAELTRSGIDGALTTCGLLGGGVNLNNYQLDGEYAISELLAPDDNIQLVNYASQDQTQTAIQQLTGAVAEAQNSASGRARTALAAALLQTPDWISGDAPPTDYLAQEAQEASWLPGQLGFVISGRPTIEQAAGGNASWNVGVDYAALIRRSEHFGQVAALYRSAGLDLRADLATLTRNADIAPNAKALKTLTKTSTVTGKLAIPELTMHTISDQLAPISYENWYRKLVDQAGHGSLLRQGFVQSIGHCNFSPAELVGSLKVLESRVATGHWPSTSAAALNHASATTGLGSGRFIDFRPPTFVNARSYDPHHGSGRGGGHHHR